MTFGQHLNASTGHEQTFYFLDVDASNSEVMETAFTVLGDWAEGALLTQEEVDKEKGVVEEEWRLRTENAYGRIQEQIMQTLLAGSRYADRNVIGDMDLIRDLQSETLRRFYEDWYRPELMTLLIIGSVDPRLGGRPDPDAVRLHGDSFRCPSCHAVSHPSPRRDPHRNLQ